MKKSFRSKDVFCAVAVSFTVLGATQTVHANPSQFAQRAQGGQNQTAQQTAQNAQAQQTQAAQQTEQNQGMQQSAQTQQTQAAQQTEQTAQQTEQSYAQTQAAQQTEQNQGMQQSAQAQQTAQTQQAQPPQQTEQTAQTQQTQAAQQTEQSSAQTQAAQQTEQNQSMQQTAQGQPKEPEPNACIVGPSTRSLPETSVYDGGDSCYVACYSVCPGIYPVGQYGVHGLVRIHGTRLPSDTSRPWYTTCFPAGAENTDFAGDSSLRAICDQAFPSCNGNCWPGGDTGR